MRQGRDAVWRHDFLSWHLSATFKFLNSSPISADVARKLSLAATTNAAMQCVASPG